MAYTASLLICNVLTSNADESVRDAAVKMRREKLGCVVVVKNKKIVGLFSERDLLNRVVAEGLDPAVTSLADVMTRNPTTIESGDALNKAFSLLADGKFRHLPVIDKGEPVGMINLSDLARVLRQVYMDDKYIHYFAESIRRAK